MLKYERVKEIDEKKNKIEKIIATFPIPPSPDLIITISFIAISVDTGVFNPLIFFVRFLFE